MTRFHRTIAAALLCGTAGAVQAATLADHKPVNEGLTIIAAGDLIQKNCDAIQPRLLRAYSYMRTLHQMARDSGFSDDQIEAFVKDKSEKKRVKSAAEAYLLSKGLDPDVPESYCTVGRYEIDRNSQIGVLLKMK